MKETGLPERLLKALKQVYQAFRKLTLGGGKGNEMGQEWQTGE